MKKTIKKSTSILLAALTLLTAISFSFSAGALEESKVRIVVRNDVYSKENGAAWDGVLVDEWVDIDENSDALSAFVSALDNHGYTQTGADYGYITEINGLSAGDGGDMSGWTGFLNDWVTSEGLNAYSVANGTLENGDEISFCYSLSWGGDLGSIWGDSTTTLTGVEFSAGTLTPDFDSAVTDYTLTVPTDIDSVKVTPNAYNKNYQVRTYLNGYTPSLDGTEYKRSAEIPVADGDKIIIGVGENDWATMNEPATATVYTFTVSKQAQSEESAVDKKLKETSDYLLTLSTPTVSSIGGEWMVLGLARSGAISEEFAGGYYENVVNYVTENGSAKLSNTKSTENSRVILALASLGKDAADVEGYNLVEPLSDFDFCVKQGINGAIWALIAVDAAKYDIPECEDAAVQNSREKLVDYILSKQLENSGWALSGTSTDPDITSMAITALAPYYNISNKVKISVDAALEALSALQNDNGGFASWGSENCESCAQVITALSSLGIDADNDERFVKNGNSVLDALLSFSVENGFAHTDGGAYNQMATEQAYYALVSFTRLSSGKTALYEMSDSNYIGLKDIDGDGYTNVKDCTEMQKHIVELIHLDLEAAYYADVNNDGVVNIADVTAYQRTLVAQ